MNSEPSSASLSPPRNAFRATSGTDAISAAAETSVPGKKVSTVSAMRFAVALGKRFSESPVCTK